MRFNQIACVIFTIILANNANSEVPKLLNYQGHIEGRAGQALTNPINLTFVIYSQPETGNALWQETQTITHENGVFQALLGSQSPFPEDLFQSNERYLEIRIQNQTPFLPRQRIVSVAYALEAARATNATGHLTPQSLSISSTKIDSSGSLTAAVIRTDSLIVGNRGIIDRQGNWTGPAIQPAVSGLRIDTIVVRNIQASLSFGSQSWLDVDGSSDVLTAFINLKKTSFIDAQFYTTVSTSGSLYETRIAIEPINPKGALIENSGNLSRFVPNNSGDLGTLSNQAVIQVTPGLYRVYVQGRTEGVGSQETSILTIRTYSQ